MQEFAYWRFLAGTIIAVAILAQPGCAVQRTSGDEPLEADADWALLPIVNYSETPRAGERAAAIVATLLRQRGIELAEYRDATEDDDRLPTLDDEPRLERGRAWALENGYDYAVTGSVEEWRYKSGLNGEPAVGLSLRVIALPDGRTVWSGSGARTGWGRASLAGTGQTVTAELLEDLAITRP